MSYRNDLKWQRELSRFDPNEQKVLLALSHEKYRWRTRDRLAEVTRLEPQDLDHVLAGLLEKDVIRPSFSKNRNLIYALKERVGNPNNR